MDEKSMNIQWYPGHMTKTRRIMEEDLKLVDAVCEILDARIPISSRNPDIDTICGSKPRMIILNRIDMADPAMVARWSEYFKRKGWAVIQTDCKLIRGDSGGPLFNLDGKLIGIHSRVGSGLEDNLHVPMKDFNALTEETAEGKTSLTPSPEQDSQPFSTQPS